MKNPQRLSPDEIETETDLNGLYWQFDSTDMVWMLFAGSVSLLVFTILEVPMPYFFSLAVVAFTLYRLPETNERMPEGRFYMTVADYIGNLWIRYVKKGVVWKSTEKAPYYEQLVEGVVEVTLENQDESIGLIRQDKGSTFAALIKGDGWSPAARNLNVQSAALSLIAAKQQMAFNKRVGLSSILHVRDYNPWPLRAFLDTALDPLVVLPPLDSEVEDHSQTWATEEVQRRSRFLHAVISSDQENKDHVRNPIAAEVVDVGGNVEIAKALRQKKGKSEPLSARVFARSPVIRAAKLSALEWSASGLKNARIASYREVIEFLAATSSHSLARFYDAQYEGKTVADDYKGYLPSQEIRIKRDYLVVDGTYIAIIKVPKKRGVVTAVSYKRLRSVLDENKLPIIMTFAKLGVSASARLEQSWLSRWLGLKDILVDTFMSRRSSASKMRQDEEEEREGSLSASNHRTHNYNIVGAVFAPDYETMEDWVSHLNDAFVGGNLTPRRISGERSLQRYWLSLAGKNRA